MRPGACWAGRSTDTAASAPRRGRAGGSPPAERTGVRPDELQRQQAVGIGPGLGPTGSEGPSADRGRDGRGLDDPQLANVTLESGA